MRLSGTILTIALFVLSSLLSCTKVVNINLNDSAPRIIIEGEISDQRSSCYIRLSKSVNFNEPNTFPPVTGALVTINDDQGNKSELTETSAGYYIAPSYRGAFDRTYTVMVTAEGKTYTASSKMNMPVTIDFIGQDVFNFNGFGAPGKIIFVKIQYVDPAGITNYYRFVEIINGKVSDEILVDNDVLRDGNNITQEIFRRDPTLNPGDSVTILLEAIDKNVYNYFSQLNQITENFGGQSATPANPTSNFDNGAFGYFSAYSVRSKSIIIK
jgi:hypothetical protein